MNINCKDIRNDQLRSLFVIINVALAKNNEDYVYMYTGRTIDRNYNVTIFTFLIEAHSFHKTLDPVQPAIECTH